MQIAFVLYMDAILTNWILFEQKIATVQYVV